MNTADDPMSDLQSIPLSPSPTSLVESLRSIGYTIETALADIVDNSISAGAANISVRFLWADGEPWVAVLDDGCGMLTQDLYSAMRFGSRSPLQKRGVNDLGRFGLGLKTASISQCRRLTVCTKTNDTISTCEWDLDYLATLDSENWLLKIIDNDALQNDELLVVLSDDFFSGLETGTIVLWRNMDVILAGTKSVDSERKFSEVMNHARRHLETVFHRFLSPDPGRKVIRIDFNNSTLTAINPFGPDLPARQELSSEEIIVEGHSVKVQPYILPHKNKVPRSEYEKYAGEGGYLHNQGFYVYRNRRLIVKATWFRLIKKEELTKLIRVRIDIPNSLDYMWAINVDKSQVTPPEVVRKKLKNIIQRITGAGKQVYQRRSAKLFSPNRIAVWKREVREGKITYSVNFDHPLINEILDDVEPFLKSRLKIIFNMVAHSFPTDVFYTDKADDQVELSPREIDTTAAVDLCRQLIDKYRECGFSQTEIEKKLAGIDIPGVDNSLIEPLLNEEREYG